MPAKAKAAAEEAQHPREGILDASMHLFSRYGFTGTTMRDIAKAVGVLPGSLYAHISSKETLLVEIVESGIEKFLAITARKEARESTATEKMRAAIRAHVAVVAENPERTLVVFHQWRYLTGPNLTRAIEKRRRYEESFSKIITEGIKNGEFNTSLDVRIAVFAILGALNWTPEWYSPKGPLKAEEIGEKLAETLLTGLVRRKG
jgi:AcrR family transcriptional regulator